MRRQRRLVLQTGGVAVLGIAAGLGVFLVFGSEEAVLLTAVGVPILLVGISGVYVWGVYTRSGTSQSEYLEQQLRRTAEAVRDVLSEYQRLREEYRRWEPDSLEDDIEQLLADLEDQGVTFSRDRKTFKLGRIASHDVQELERLESKAPELEERTRDSFGSFVRAETERTRRELSRLADGDLVEADEIPDPPDREASDVNGLAENLRSWRDEAASLVDTAIDTLERLARDQSVRPDVMESLEAARSEVRNGEVADAVDHVMSARDAVEGELSEPFERERNELERLLETMSETIEGTPVGQETLDRIETIRSELEQQDSSLELGAVRARRDELRSECLELVGRLEDELDRHLRTLDRRDVPDQFFVRPSAADRNYVDSLERGADGREFRDRWKAAFSELHSAVDEVRTKASVAENYPEVEPRIDGRLEREGRVTGDDLPIKSTTEVMQLYASSHRDVRFDPTVPLLASETGGETYAVSIVVEFDDVEERRPVDVSLVGDEGTWRERLTVEDRSIAEFEEIPYGEYRVRAEPKGEQFGSDEATVVVDDDTDVSLGLSKASVITRLCDGREQEIREHLTDFADRLDEQFHAEGYVSSEMEFPLSDEYLPCLVALWADTAGHTAVLGDDATVYAFDETQVQSELETAARYNVEAGSEVRFETLRNRFLSAPLPDSTLADLAEESGIETIAVTDTGIRKREETTDV